MLDKDRRRAVRKKRWLADQHLVSEHAERVEVAAPVDLPLAGSLLGGHVRRRPDCDAGRGQTRITITDCARNAEVGDHRTAALGIEENIVRLDVSMDHAAFVRVSECVGDIAQCAPRLLDRQCPPIVQALGEVVAGHVRHDEVDESRAVRIIGRRGLVDAVNVNDIRVIELGCRLGLSQKARLDLAAKCQFGRQHLNGNCALQAPIFRSVDDPHSAAPDLAVQLVVRRRYKIGHSSRSG